MESALDKLDDLEYDLESAYEWIDNHKGKSRKSCASRNKVRQLLEACGKLTDVFANEFESSEKEDDDTCGCMGSISQQVGMPIMVEKEVVQGTTQESFHTLIFPLEGNNHGVIKDHPLVNVMQVISNANTRSRLSEPRFLGLDIIDGCIERVSRIKSLRGRTPWHCGWLVLSQNSLRFLNQLMALFDPAGAQVLDVVPSSSVPAITSAPSRSRSVTETINGSHHFTIQGYSLAKGMGVGKYIASDTFSVGGYQWAVYFYPDGKNPEDQSIYVSVFIALASEGTDVRALFELTLLDQSGRGKHKVHSHFDRALESGPYTLKYRGSMWGYKRFFRRTGLETSEYLKNDRLSISCTVGVVVSSTQGPRLYSIPVPDSNIGEQFGALLDDGDNTDVTFVVGSETFKAHKLVLAARSPVFRAQLYGVLADNLKDTFEIQDIEPPVFQVYS
ncbi:hypothetical protein L7F22_060548 [Adiantum nelumboides]|nr:hypothetical protein [Adiantum nelumboides]